jgi:hypothetical protein
MTVPEVCKTEKSEKAEVFYTVKMVSQEYFGEENH